MAGFAEIVGRAEVTDQLIPDQQINEIIQTAPEESVVLTRARKTLMSSKKSKQPVLATLPEAYWVDGDTGLKQTTNVSWRGITMTAEELAVIVPIPNAVVDDSNVPLWDQVKPLLREALGKKVDGAALFGDDKPASWPTAIVPGAIAAGNVAQLSATNNLADAFASVAGAASEGGFAVNAFATRPGLNWQLRGLKDANGQYLFGAPTQGGNATLFGYTLDEVRNGAWDADVAEGLAVDWSKFVVGIRQDVTYDLFSEGVISDAEGRVVLNLMQQDSKAMRVVFRVGFQAAVPMTRLGGTYPAGVVTPAATGA
ncbi:phage major capsid protein [Georgenia sp. TF02-10]|uniref:phage major capsid protein n=1 Tax=Georgenia sp. TF02-10 TaxID=2917725 RepID=UPI001FA79427|nr:phage major capsid protein [Georgenia sp. TF02-10]UNX54088.1 phage major capsid protein [Georgenia sp. TF02-10]